MKFDVANRFTSAVQFTTDIECSESTPYGVKLGLAAKYGFKNEADLSWADLSRADLSRAGLSRAGLSGADLSRADLSRADLSRADLSRADLGRTVLIDGGQRFDGYRFVGWIKEGVVQILAGCRSFPIEKAREHWIRTRGGTPLGDETMSILDHIEQAARIRGLTKEKSDD